MLKLTAKSLKCTLVISPSELVGIGVPNGTGAVPFVIEVGHRKVTGTFNPKSLRKACVAAAAGATGHVIVQGNLSDTNALESAGIAVTPPKAPVAQAAD